jgi:tRNA(Glu) U13 pseudouridine synthase TruD
MKSPTGEPVAFETRIVEAAGLKTDDLRQSPELRGARRPLRFRPSDCRIETGADAHGAYLQLAFTLPSGCYATTLVREVCKSDTESEAQAR